jgi:hypothetical protein
VDNRFDGDALQFTILMDGEMEEKFESFAPYQNSFGLKNPREMSDAQSMPKPVLATMANYLAEENEPVDPHKLALMQQHLLAA